MKPASDSSVQWVTRAEIARRCGVAEQSVSAWFKDGFPAWARDGLRRKKAGRWQYHADLQLLWEKHQEPAEPEEIEGVSLPEAKRRRAVAQAELAELQLAEARRQDELSRGNVLPRDEYTRFTREVVGIARDRLAGLPKDLAKLVDSEPEQKRLLKEGERIVNAVLKSMGQSFEEGPAD